MTLPVLSLLSCLICTGAECLLLCTLPSLSRLADVCGLWRCAAQDKQGQGAGSRGGQRSQAPVRSSFTNRGMLRARWAQAIGCAGKSSALRRRR